MLALLGADPAKVALDRRVYYMLAVYTGLRKDSLLALKWDSIDFTHRTLTSLESKAGLPQIFGSGCEKACSSCPIPTLLHGSRCGFTQLLRISCA